jgi:hypothetical protein
MAEKEGWIEFDCPCCGIDYDIPDVRGVPQWPTHDHCGLRRLTHSEAVNLCQHYDTACVPSGLEPPVSIYG